MANGQLEQLDAAMQGVDPALVKVVTQTTGQGGQENQQALQQLQEAAQAAGFEVGGVSQLGSELEQLSDFEQQFIFNWLKDKAQALINTVLGMVRNLPHCISGVRLATEAVNLFRAGQYMAALAKAGAAYAALRACVS